MRKICSMFALKIKKFYITFTSVYQQGEMEEI